MDRRERITRIKAKIYNLVRDIRIIREIRVRLSSRLVRLRYSIHPFKAGNHWVEGLGPFAFTALQHRIKKKEAGAVKIIRECCGKRGENQRGFSADIASSHAEPGGDIHHEACGDRGPLLLHESLQNSSEILSGKERTDHDGKRGKMPAEP
jgi:hypothetical protein